MIKVLKAELFWDTAGGGSEGTDQQTSVIIIGVTQIYSLYESCY